MRAIVYDRYGGPEVLRLEEVGRPVPAQNEVLLEVQAAAVNPLDWHYMRGKPFMVRFMAGMFKPNNKILGADVAGRVVAAGSQVEGLLVGDEVFGGIGAGAFAEYVAVDAELLVRKPDTISYEEAAAVPVAGLTALQRLRDDGRLRAGQTVLINGASGGVGPFAVQIAKLLGAEVTGVCSTNNVEMVRSLGADHVIDYTQQAFTASGERYDLILDNVGNHSLAACERALNPGGTYLYNSDSMVRILQLTLKGLRSGEGKRMVTADLTRYGRDDLAFLAEHLESGDLAAVIDRRYPLRQTSEAIGYVEAGHARGKVVIAVGSSEEAASTAGGVSL